MHNSFFKYEQDFNEWVDAGFPDINPLSQDFLLHLQDERLPRRLWKHQMIGVQRVVYAYEKINYKDILLNIVTGGGKTAIMGAIMAWLKVSHNISKFVVLCPNTIVRDRLEEDFVNANVFRNFQFFPYGSEHLINEMGLHMLNPDTSGILGSGIILGNIHQLYESSINGQRNLGVILNHAGQIAVFNDEAHNTPATEYDNTLRKLSKISRFRLDTTATPDRADGKTPDAKMIYEFNISDAQATVPPIVKSVVVYQPKISSVQLTYTNPATGEKRTVDEMDEEFDKIEKGLSSTQWVTDAEPMEKQIAIAINRLEEQRTRARTLGHGSYKPILFVVGICIKDATEAAKMLQETFKLNTIVVTEESSDDDRLLAGIIGKQGKALEEAQKNLERKVGLSKAKELIERGKGLEAIVSVLMLREGWDVPAVSVILLLRKFSSPVYGQQVIGRGLRLNVRTEDIQEIVAVVDHEKLKHQWLWDLLNAKVKREVEQGSLFGIEEDLPIKRKQQEMTNPENLIDIPEPIEDDESGDFDDILKIDIITSDLPDWQSVLNSFEYGDDVEITKVTIENVKGKNISDPQGFFEIIDAPDIAATVKSKIVDKSKEELVDILKHSIRDIASYLLKEEGIGSHELGYLYNILMDHIRVKLLEGHSAGMASKEELNHAIHHRVSIQHNFNSINGLVSSIVKYKVSSNGNK
jgi:superfamily II DNA or RNA helicase